MLSLRRRFAYNGQYAILGGSEVGYQSFDFIFLVTLLPEGFDLRFFSMAFDHLQLRVCPDSLGKARNLVRRTIAPVQFYDVGLWEEIPDVISCRRAVRVDCLAGISENGLFSLEQPRKHHILNWGVVLHFIDNQMFHVLEHGNAFKPD